MLEQKGKATEVKMTKQLEEIKQKVLAKEKRLKKYRDREEQNRRNRKFQNNERKFYQQLEDGTKTYQKLDVRKAKQFWIKIWLPREHKKRMISNMGKEIGLEEGPKAKMHIDSFRKPLKIPNWKTPDNENQHGF